MRYALYLVCMVFMFCTQTAFGAQGQAPPAKWITTPQLTFRQPGDTYYQTMRPAASKPESSQTGHLASSSPIIQVDAICPPAQSLLMFDKSDSAISKTGPLQSLMPPMQRTKTSTGPDPQIHPQALPFTLPSGLSLAAAIIVAVISFRTIKWRWQ